MKIIRTFGALLFLMGMFLIQSCTESIDTGFSGEELLALSSDYNDDVHLEDIVSLHGGNANVSRSEMDIDCICDVDNDTLLYVYNKPEGGWVIYSSDTRVPPIIAESESGSFSELLKDENVKSWVESLASDLKLVKACDDTKLNFSAMDIANNKNFWRPKPDLTESSFYAKTENGVSVTGVKDLPPLILEARGHYEYKYTAYFTETYDSIRPLITTDWSQFQPFNMYCPYKNDGSGERAPAGCVPIAGAQMLYFLHHKFGVPETAPSKAYCYGDVTGDYATYNWNQTDFNSEIWDTMMRDDEAAAPLIAYVGRSIMTRYGNYGSSSYFSYLVKRLFLKYKISSVLEDYNEAKLKESLLNGMPVLIDAISKKRVLL